MGNSNEYMKEYMKRRYYERRNYALNLLGNECAECGSKDNLEIDHTDKYSKTLDIAKMWSVNKQRFLAELSLCQLLCTDCHKAKTSEENSVGSSI